MLMDAMEETMIESVDLNMVGPMMFDNQMYQLMVKDDLVVDGDPYEYIEPLQSIPYSPFLQHRLFNWLRIKKKLFVVLKYKKTYICFIDVFNIRIPACVLDTLYACSMQTHTHTVE